MNPPDQPCQATSAGDLRQQIMDSRVPKNEREWWASREIEKLERELAAAKAECERLTANQRQPAEDIFVSHLCDELARLRAELERFTGHGLLDCHAICDQRDAAVAERDQLRAEVERLTPYVSKAILTHGGTMLCSPQVGVAFNEQQARAEQAEAALAFIAENGGTTHETECGTINCNGLWCAEQARAAMKAEAECLEQARLLGMSGEREADLLGKIERLNRVIERASVQFFHEGSDGETAAKMLTVLNEAK